MHDTTQRGERAVVIGGSIGGLLAASVLADAYREVMIVDRDRFGDYGEYRKGALQARHAHGLLAGGQQAIESLLPGITAELVDRGAILGDIQGNLIWVNEGYSLTNTPTGLQGLLTSRLLLEDQVRRRVRALSNVVLHERCDVLGLRLGPDGHTKGVRVSWRDRDDTEAQLDADLVIDASGRGSRAPAWLQALGFGAPRVDEITVGLTYTTREFVKRDDDGSPSIVAAATVANPRGGVVLAQPDGRWVVTIGGYLGEAAPTDLDGFREFAGGLASSHIADRLAHLEPVGDARTFKYHASAWRRYDRMRRMPEGFVVMADAICSFNPIYGQGMTVAAREAVALRDILRRHGVRGIGKRMAKAAAREIAVPWELAASSDLRLPAVQGPRSPKVSAVNWYLARYFRAAAHDDDLSLAFLRVVNLLARPESLFTPAKMLRVARRRDVALTASPTPAGVPA